MNMNKTITILCVLMLAVSVGLSGQPPLEEGKPAPAAKVKKDTVSGLILRYGIFSASDQDFKDIYDGSATVFGGELRLGGEKLGGWLEAGYLKKDGKLSYTGEPTTVKILSVEGGPMYRFLVGKICPYAGIGAGYYKYQESNVIGDVSKGGFGFCGMAGVGLQLLKPLLIDLKLKYSSCSMTPADFDIQIGGLSVGFGLGIKF
jgi:opacity protein-like surface antigen